MRVNAALLSVALLSACASANPDRNRGARAFAKPVANPSAVVAAELGFARLAQEKGQWTAFRETKADDAAMFSPDLVNADDFLRNRPDPESAVEWQPHKIFISCTGSLAASTGAWQAANGSQGYFTTIWQRDRKGEYQWVFDHGQPLSEPLTEPDFIETEVADCEGELPANLPVSKMTAEEWVGISDDRTFIWIAETGADSSSRLVVQLYKDGQHREVIENLVPAPN